MFLPTSVQREINLKPNLSYESVVLIRHNSLFTCLQAQPNEVDNSVAKTLQVTLGSFTLHFGLKYEIIYQLKAFEYLFVFFQLDMFRAYTPIFRSNGCYNFFTYAAYGVLGVVRCRS